MVHTRKHKKLRLRIGCLDHTLIPETTDVFIQRGFFKLAFDVEPVTVTQLGHEGIEDIGGSNGGGDDNGSNKDNGDAANDMDIEKTRNNENQNNGNKRIGNVQQGNNGKGVVSHQVQEPVKGPILFGSLNNDLLSKGMENAKTIVPSDVLQHSSHLRLNSGENSNFIELCSSFYVATNLDNIGTDSRMDAAPGLVKNEAESALGSAKPGPADSPLLLQPKYTWRDTSGRTSSWKPVDVATGPAVPPIPWTCAAVEAGVGCLHAISRHGICWHAPGVCSTGSCAGPLPVVASDAYHGGSCCCWPVRVAAVTADVDGGSRSCCWPLSTAAGIAACADDGIAGDDSGGSQRRCCPFTIRKV
jgi:hypothetical protein